MNIKYEINEKDGITEIRATFDKEGDDYMKKLIGLAQHIYMHYRDRHEYTKDIIEKHENFLSMIHREITNALKPQNSTIKPVEETIKPKNIEI